MFKAKLVKSVYQYSLELNLARKYVFIIVPKLWKNYQLAFYNSLFEVVVVVVNKNKWGARGVMVIVAGYGHGDTSSNPGPDWLHFT